VFVLSQHPSIASHFLAGLRDTSLQRHPSLFRQNLLHLGQILAYEISKTFQYSPQETPTPLGVKQTDQIQNQLVLATILRAGLPFHQGFLAYWEHAENAFIGAYRGKHQAGEAFEIVQRYITSPDLDGKTLVLTDPMLATGKSIVTVYEALLQYGKPAVLHVAAVIGSQAGVDYVRKHLPTAQLWIGDIDPELNTSSYIVPGLGDAGDLAFGEKL